MGAKVTWSIISRDRINSPPSNLNQVYVLRCGKQHALELWWCHWLVHVWFTFIFEKIFEVEVNQFLHWEIERVPFSNKKSFLGVQRCTTTIMLFPNFGKAKMTTIEVMKPNMDDITQKIPKWTYSSKFYDTRMFMKNLSMANNENCISICEFHNLVY